MQAKKDVSDIHADLGRDGLLEAIQSNLLPIEPVPINSWVDALSRAVVSSSELASLALTPRRKLLGDFFCEGDLGFIYAFRGVGKTWMGLGMARALAEGGALGPWRAHEATNVLYVDGEMPPDLMRDRDRGLRRDVGEVKFLNHEILFDRTQKVLNITNPEVQQAITSRCLEEGIKVIVLDNLSTLASGMKENEASAWEQVARTSSMATTMKRLMRPNEMELRSGERERAWLRIEWF